MLMIMVSESCFPDVKMEERRQFGALRLYVFSLRHAKRGEY